MQSLQSLLLNNGGSTLLQHKGRYVVKKHTSMSARLSRQGKEALFRRKATELETRWGNPIPNDWGFIEQWSDDELDDALANAIKQLRFEKDWPIFVTLVVFVTLGVIGLLVFGIKQLFP
jgi:hypothetical protein